jgi:hypothetical protein
MAVAIVSGFSIGTPLTIGADPASLESQHNGSFVVCPSDGIPYTLSNTP